MSEKLCPTCNKRLSTGASLAGKAKFFCVNNECPDRFKAIDDPDPVVKPDE